MKDAQNSAGELLLELEKLGITFELEEEKLKYKDAHGNFSEAYREKAKTYKAEIIEILKKDRLREDSFLDRDHRTDEYPLTDVQAAYLIGKTEAVNWGGVGCKGYIEVNFGTASIKELTNAWETLVNRHEMLRARVTETGFKILDRNAVHYKTEVVELPENDVSDKLDMLREEFSTYMFDTASPPLFKAVITKRKEGNFFHLLVDLIILDFASVQLLVSEMGDILKGDLLKEITTKFSDYVLLNRDTRKNLKWYRDRAYWLNRLEKMPEGPLLPRDGRAADVPQNAHEFYRFQRHINIETWNSIKKTAGEYGVTVSAALIAVYTEVVARWSENKRFTLNLPIQNRPEAVKDINAIAGDFTAVNLLVVDASRPADFIERIRDTAGQLLEDLEHSSFSGVEVLRELNKVSKQKEILMPVVFTGVLKSMNDAATIEYGFSHTPQVWIDCQVVETNGLMVSWDARKSAVKESIVSDMFEAFISTIEMLGKSKEDWNKPLEVVMPFGKGELVSFEQSGSGDRKQFIQQGFVEYARKNPGKTAVIDALGKVAYGDLLKDAEYIAGYLREHYGEAGRGLVAVKMRKSSKQIAAAIGILIAGFAYLPVDMKQPVARQKKILERAAAIAELDEETVENIIKNSVHRSEDHFLHDNPAAYVIFTSGSTGEPKGVEVSHAAAQNTIAVLNEMYHINESDKVLGIAELSFDLSVFDIFGVLGAGGTLVLPDPEKGPDASHWGELIKEFGVTLWNTVPAQAEMLDAFSAWKEKYPSVRIVLLSGDWINTSLPGRLRKIMPDARIISLGGATEGGIWSIYHEIGEAEETPTILYGKALPNQWMGVLDDELRICPEYAAGQIAIGGNSLAEGYLGDTTLTEEKFIWVDDGKNRIYLTGDRGRYVENGQIEFLGRMDNQVKINGHRIEIAEVEVAIREIPQIEDCCVVHHMNEGKGKLTAFIKDRKKDLKKMLEEVKAPEGTLDAETIEQFHELLEKAVCSTVYAKLSDSFMNKPPLSRADIMTLIEVKSQYEDLLKRWLDLLVDQGYLLEENEMYVMSGKESKAAEYWEEIQSNPYADIAPNEVSRYIQSHAENICSLFRGMVNPLVFLFPKGRTEIAESLYGRTAIAKLLNGIIADIVKKYAENFEKLKVLEVGGGIGATTKQVLKSIDGMGYEYLFTDVSNFFLNNISGQYPQVKTGLLNLDEWEPSEFGVFHVIIAAGVLNNTKDIPNTIRKLGDMLSDDGILLVTEPVEEHIEITVSQAFMMPEHSDMRSMTGHCFLDEDEWTAAFDHAGLEVIHMFPERNADYSKFKQDLFVVRKKQADYKEYLKSVLPAAMIPAEFIPIDEIPLSSNGKVDRKSLVEAVKVNDPAIKCTGDDVQVPEADVHSELENSIAEIMAFVSGNPNISHNDNLLENGFDSLLLSQAAGKIVSEIPEAEGLRFDEILRIALAAPTITEISRYVTEKGAAAHPETAEESCTKPIETPEFHKVVYVCGEEDTVLTEGLKTSGALVKKTDWESLKAAATEDAEISDKYLLIFQSEVSEILAGASELLAEGVGIKKVFLVNPESAKINDLYLGDAVIINGTQPVIDSWKAAVLGEISEYKGNSDELYHLIKREFDDEK